MTLNLQPDAALVASTLSLDDDIVLKVCVGLDEVLLLHGLNLPNPLLELQPPAPGPGLAHLPHAAVPDWFKQAESVIHSSVVTRAVEIRAEILANMTHDISFRNFDSDLNRLNSMRAW